jgi:hypothetical protein
MKATRTVFLALVALNLLLFGWVRGMYGSGSGREPARLEQQVAPDRIRVLTESEVQQVERRAAEAKEATAAAAAARAAVAAAPPVIAAAQSDGACVEIGEFASEAQLVRLREKLAGLKLADRASEETRERPGWYLVYLPPEKSSAEAEARAEQLRSQGWRDLMVFKEEGALRNAIGLGSFRDRDLARKQVALLDRRGIKGARVAENPTSVKTTRVLIRGADAASVKRLEQLQRDFPQQKIEPCTPEP